MVACLVYYSIDMYAVVGVSYGAAKNWGQMDVLQKI